MYPIREVWHQILRGSIFRLLIYCNLNEYREGPQWRSQWINQMSDVRLVSNIIFRLPPGQVAKVVPMLCDFLRVPAAFKPEARLPSSLKPARCLAPCCTRKSGKRPSDRS